MLIRASTPPTDVLDLVDRLIHAIASGHWTARTVAWVAGVALSVTTPVLLLGAVVGVLLVLLGLPVSAAGALSALAMGGAAVKAFTAFRRLLRRHRDVPPLPGRSVIELDAPV